MLILNRHLRSVNDAQSSSVRPDHAATRLRWMNFNRCPHCQARGRNPLVMRLNENGPMISRSDGQNFHLVLGDRPIEYPAERASGKSDMLTAGFWYQHEANGGSTETVVVILRKPAKGGVTLPRLLNTIADKLFDRLTRSSLLERTYEFENNQLHGL
jgi:hypothetical protein